MYSKRWYPYTSDSGIVYGIFVDESNTELVSATADGLSVPLGTTALPQGYTARNVVLQAPSGQQKTCYVLSFAEFALIGEGDIFATIGNDGLAIGTAYTCVRKNAEKRRRQPLPFDTGINDGDNP